MHRVLTMQSSTSTMTVPRYTYAAELANIQTSHGISEEQARECKWLH